MVGLPITIGIIIEMSGRQIPIIINRTTIKYGKMGNGAIHKLPAKVLSSEPKTVHALCKT